MEPKFKLGQKVYQKESLKRLIGSNSTAKTTESCTILAQYIRSYKVSYQIYPSSGCVDEDSLVPVEEAKTWILSYLMKQMQKALTLEL